MLVTIRIRFRKVRDNHRNTAVSQSSTLHVTRFIVYAWSTFALREQDLHRMLTVIPRTRND
jgi:hypothetical protein